MAFWRNEDYLTVDGIGIRTRDYFQFYMSDPDVALSSCNEVTEKMKNLMLEWDPRNPSPIGPLLVMQEESLLEVWYSLVVAVVNLSLPRPMLTALRSWQTFPGHHCPEFIVVEKLHAESQQGIPAIAAPMSIAVYTWVSLIPQHLYRNRHSLTGSTASGLTDMAVWLEISPVSVMYSQRPESSIWTALCHGYQDELHVEST